jgi:hypothetical protein
VPRLPRGLRLPWKEMGGLGTVLQGCAVACVRHGRKEIATNYRPTLPWRQGQRRDHEKGTEGDGGRRAAVLRVSIRACRVRIAPQSAMTMHCEGVRERLTQTSSWVGILSEVL